MERLISKKWWKAAGTRAIKTFSQTFVGSIAVGTTINNIDWITIISISGVAALLSIFTSIAGLPEVKEDN